MDNAITFHDKLAPAWEAKYKKLSFRSRYRVLDLCLGNRNLSNNRWLDAGCGGGVLSLYLASKGCQVTAVDASPAMLEVAAQLAAQDRVNCQIKFVQVSSVEEMELEERNFDGILCNSVLEYVTRPETALAKFAAHVESNGRLLVSVPNRFSIVRLALWLVFRATSILGTRAWPKYMAFSQHAYGRAEFSRLLEKHGFRTVKTVSFGGPIPFILQRVPCFGSLRMFVAERISLTR
jgi:2-polyprenyl-6-hydroxyphenyl methylase/3-demethylubiquinone-9 3-methyltransferase